MKLIPEFNRIKKKKGRRVHKEQWVSLGDDRLAIAMIKAPGYGWHMMSK